MMNSNFCRVCGLDQEEPVRGGNICPCCGVEFGYEDATLYALMDYQQRWIAGGMQWHDPKQKPADWDAQAQMKNIRETRWEDTNINCCRVCGLDQGEPPWGESGQIPTYFICPCCGTEFGYHDNTLTVLKNHRQKWLEQGAKWFTPKEKPKDWNLEEQMKNIPVEFR